MVLLLQSSRRCSELKTSPRSSVNRTVVSTPDRYWSLFTGWWLPVQQRIQYKQRSSRTRLYVDFRSAVHRRTPASTVNSSSDDVVSSCGPPMLRVSQCRGHTLRQPSERSEWRLRTSGTHYRTTFATPVPCQASVPSTQYIGIIFITAPWRGMKTRLDAVFSSPV